MRGHAFSGNFDYSHSHNECTKLFKTICKFCGQRAWYFENQQGSKIFFHDVPWEGGDWDPHCPKTNLTSNYEGEWEAHKRANAFFEKIFK